MISLSFVKTIVFITALFSMTGGIALLNMLVNGTPLNEPYPKVLALTPIAMFLTVLGLTGTYLIILFSRNSHKNDVVIARKQFYVGFSLLFSCYIGLELLLNYGLS